MDKRKFNILLLEDNLTDAELVEHLLKKTGINFEIKRVDTAADFIKQIHEFKPDLILSDYSLPVFDGLEALKIAKKTIPEVPYVFVSGHIGEDRAIEALRVGASDYVLKDKINKLVPTVTRVLEDIVSREKIKNAEKALKESEKSFRGLFNSITDAIYILDESGIFLDVNPGVTKMYGYEKDELLGQSPAMLSAEGRNNLDEINKKINLAFNGESQSFEFWGKRKNGEIFPKDVVVSPGNYFGQAVVIAIARDISGRKLSENKIKKSEKQYKELVENINEVVFRLSTGGVIKYLSPIAEHLFEATIEELFNSRFINFVHPDDADKALKDFQIVLTGKSVISNLRTISKSGKIRWIRASSKPIINGSGVEGIQGIITDITKQKRAEEELIEAKEKAEESDRLKSEFLAQMSHEIRTPLNVILSYNSYLREEILPQISNKYEKIFDSMDSAGKRLLRTIDLIINMSMVQTGRISISLVECDVEPLLKSIIAEFRSVATQKNLLLKFTNNTGKVKIVIDDYLFSQIIQNLVDNAIKYTNEGTVELITFIKDDIFFISVKDTGIGISDEYLPSIFEPFSQEESGYSRPYEGNGLGLALVNNYVNILKGDIEVESKKGQGTTFTISFKNYLSA